jgi:tetratricopeptide (TPR) repeat protein
MPDYLWDCDDGSGKRTFLSMPARTIEESKDILLRRGYKDLKLQTDDVFAASVAAFGNQTPSATELFTPEQQVHKFRNSLGSLEWVIVRVLRDNAWLYLLSAVFVSLHFVSGRSWRLVDTLLVAMVAAFTCFSLFHRLPVLLFAQLTRAREWNNWDQCLAILSQLETIGKWGAIRLPKSTIAHHRALAWAGTNRLDEALKVFEPFGDGKEIPEWLYLAQVSVIYATARDFDKSIEYGLRAIEKKPGDSSLHLDHGFRLVFRKRDVVGAKLALRKAEENELVEWAQMFLSRLKGCIAMEEGDYSSAKQQLLKALEQAKPFKNMPFMGLNINLAKALLCVVEGKLGNREQATAYLKEVQAILVAKGEQALLQRCMDATCR